MNTVSDPVLPVLMFKVAGPTHLNMLEAGGEYTEPGADTYLSVNVRGQTLAAELMVAMVEKSM